MRIDPWHGHDDLAGRLTGELAVIAGRRALGKHHATYGPEHDALMAP